MNVRRMLGFAFAAVLLLILLPAVSLSQDKEAPPVSAKIEAELLDLLSVKGSADFIVTMAEQADLSAAYQMQDWQARGRYVYDTLKQVAERSQAQAIAQLDSAGLRHRTFIAGNELYVWAGNLGVANSLAGLPEVAAIRATRVYKIEPPILSAAPEGEVVWGIQDTRADDFWSDFGIKGEGIVIASIDSGADYTHDALYPNYKCGVGPHDACWYDPGSADCSGPDGGPCDTEYMGIYHGTHTMGTMAAKDDPALPYTVGMAPNAQWITCLGCPFGGCPDYDLDECADWILAPGGDPNNRPHIVNNSWGGGGGYDWYLPKVNAWRAAGVFPAFSAGNSGPSCNSLGSPGDYQESFGSAAHQSSRDIADFSSRGPSFFGDDPYTKPNISAPGQDVLSAQPGDSWASISGTSMASPHSAGAVALLWSCNPTLVGQIDQTFEILQDFSDPPPDGNCGAPTDGEGNYTFGYGYLNPYAAGLQWCGETGTLDGHVYEAGSATPIGGVSIEAARQGGGLLTALTDDSGAYGLTAMVGLYDVTASKYGYMPQMVTGVEVLTDTVTTQDFALDPAPMYTVDGTVTDAATGWPLYARIGIDGYPYSPVWTNPETGYYSVELVAGVEYLFNVDAWTPGYVTDGRLVGPLTGNRTENFALVTDAACAAPGYRPRVAYSQDFEASNGLYVATGTNSTWKWGAPTSGPGAAHSGVNVWATELDGNYLDNEDSYLTSRNINLSTLAGQGLVLSWWQWLQTESCCDYAEVLVSKNGGASWTSVYGPAYGYTDMMWAKHEVLLDPSYAVLNFRIRFHLWTDGSVTYPGWYVDDIVISGDCQPQPGGLVVGNVYDENTADPLPGADVSNDSGEATVALPTPEDPAVDDAFYVLFSPAGAHTFTAAKSGYLATNELVAVVAGDAVRQDFSLPAGWLSVTPTGLAATLDMGSSTTLPLTLNNKGGNAASFALEEQDRGFEPARARTPASGPPFTSPAAVGPLSVRSPEGRAAHEAGPLAAPLAWMEASPMPVGVVRYAHAQCPGDNNSFYVVSGVDSNFSVTVNAWRYDADTDTWNALAPIPFGQEGPAAVCDEGYLYVLGGGGTNQFYIYDIATDSWSAGPALPRSVWGAAAGVDNGRIYLAGGDSDFYFGGTSGEVDIYDIAAGTWIGKGAPMPSPAATPGFVQLGSYLYVAGGWNDGSPGSNVDQTQRYDLSADAWETGPVFSSGRADLALAGTSQALYAMGGDANGGGPFDPSPLVERLDWTTWPGGSWQDIGDPLPASFTSNMAGFCTDSVAGGEVWSVGGYDGGFIVGRAFYRPAESCFTPDIPWLSEEPVTGMVPALDSAVIQVTFDAGVPEVTQPGDYHGVLRVGNDTPYGTPGVPVTMTVLAPETWGKLEGTVTGLGYCDENPAPLQNADVYVQASDGMSWNLTTNQDGNYKVWLDESHSPLTVTVTYAEHETGQATGVIVTGLATTRVDFSVRWLRPCVSTAPASMEVTVLRGSSEARPLTLYNNGAASTPFSMQEKEGTVWPPKAGMVTGKGEWLYRAEQGVEMRTNRGETELAYPKAYRWQPDGRTSAVNILVYADDFMHTAPNTYVDQALRALGLPYTAHYDGDFGGFASDLSSGGPWDLVIFENANYNSNSTGFPQMLAYVQGGGRLAAEIWTMLWDNADPLYAEMGVSYVANDSAAPPVYWWDPSHPIFTTPESAPPWLSRYCPAAWSCGQYLDPVAGLSGAVAGYTGDPAAGQGALIVRNDGQTVYKGFADTTTDADADGDGLLDGVELWINVIDGIQYGFAADVIWLSEEPVSGTVDADSTFPIEVTFTALPTMPAGIYTATLLARTEDPVNRAFGTPVTMTVVHAPACSFESSSPDELGETTFFTNTTDEGLSPTTYEWDFGDGSPVSPLEHPEHDYAHVGLYDVVLTATNQWGEEACSDTISIKGVEASFVSNSPVILGSPVIFTNTTLSNPPVVQWFWTFGDSYSSEEENPVHTFAETGIYTVTLFAANLPYQIQGGVYDIYQATVEVRLPFDIYLPVVVRNH